MPLDIVYRQDITKIACDAIVNAARNSLLGGGGIDGAIHAAAGPGLLEECRTLGGCDTGDAKITKAYDLPCRYVIHTVGPVWQGGTHGEEELLRSCYRTSLELAARNGCGTVAFPVISAGAFGYPKTEALSVAVDEISRFLLTSDMNVTLSVYFARREAIRGGLYEELSDRMGYRAPAGGPLYSARPVSASVSPAEHGMARSSSVRRNRKDRQETPAFESAFESACEDFSVPLPLEQRLKTLDESFSQMLLRKIDEAGMTDAECYRRANVDRKHFSKIRSNANYKPTKTTALAFAVALRLSAGETDELLMKAGFAFSPSRKLDVIVRYFIETGEYDIGAINSVLFAFDQSLLGARSE